MKCAVVILLRAMGARMTTKEKKRYSTEFTPRFSDFDVQGILNSKNYIDFLSEARIEQMIRCYKLPMDHYMKMNQTWVFSSVQMNFLRPVYLGKKIVVETEVYKIDGSKAWVSFLIRGNDASSKHAEGEAIYTLIDIQKKIPISISDQDIQIFLSSGV